MNSLVGMGAVTSFAAGAASTLLPGAGFDASFLEEPVMLLAFVLLGRTLETRARLRASGACLLSWLLVTRTKGRLATLLHVPDRCQHCLCAA